ncbi:uncharacterized protein PGTG_02063 [Puccinia graminis f. sp. tritici CRL 75-36-700-3]|uniref:Uncharacterized protein n=1 Tax=Puccinia graminis f. sp. tritici (strain CRL 75-36-700-3 / race SCCL) TaxID=418459 RepID=E3JX27_PUCGT|nr:uncharacterized protein PGTG_02063 [Puccinia graminis f. sp. tritici CRL 75-36-700-3]EFP76602.1 hypothetical protein PGTG_02063 [Puccinia graminis f. sp. tritici CRL 75-36-700-3]
MDGPISVRRPQAPIVDEPMQETAIIVADAYLSNSNQTPLAILPKSLNDQDSCIPTDLGLDLQPNPPLKELEEKHRTDTPAFDEKVEIVPITDADSESPIMTVRSVLIGVLLSAFGVSITQLFLFKPVHMQIKLIFLQMIGTYELYFDRVISFGVAFGILMSSQLIGEVLPSVSLLTSLFKVGSESEDQVRFFKKAFVAVSIYEIFPTYITPAFQAINIFCLTLPKNQLVTTIFGGARPFEGMGLFSISADWSMVGGRGPLYLPLSTQIHQLVALVVSTLAFFLVYSKSWFGAGLTQNFPFMSASLLTADGKTYPYRQAVNADGGLLRSRLWLLA